MSAGDQTRATQGRRRVTIKDVARQSDVSPATVTRSLQRDPRIPATTRRRVEQAARELGYRPDHVAQALVTGSSRTIGLLIPTIGDPYWAEVAEGIEERAGEDGFSVLLATSHGNPARAERMLEIFLSKRVDGIVIADSGGAVESCLANTGGWPVVVIGWDPPIAPHVLAKAQSATTSTLLRAGRRRGRVPNTAYISFDDVDGGQLVAHHLVELGHREVAFLGGPSTRSTALRVGGSRVVFEEAGFSFRSVSPGADTLEGGRAATLELLRVDREITAIVAYDDLVAIGVLDAAHALGIDVPGELSVVGFDDIELTRFVEPSLTSVRQPKREIGTRAVQLLFEQIEGKECGKPELLHGTLVPRASTSPP